MSTIKEKFKKAKNRKESYSSLDLLQSCPYKYFLKYVMGNYSSGTNISLEIGNLCHSILERIKSPTTVFNRDDLIKEFDEKIKQLQDNFLEDWITQGKSGLLYKDKIKIFRERIATEPDGFYKAEQEWNVIAVEKPFEITYQGLTIIGKIDKIEQNKDGHYRITDYKTSDRAYKDEDIKTALQMFIYALACKQEYGEFPIEFVYDFILINEKKLAMTKGWEKRGYNKLDKLVALREKYYASEEFVPSPTPLCHWCDYCNHSVSTDDNLKNECQYYSLWTPTNKTFAVNYKYASSQNKKEEKEEFIW